MSFRKSEEITLVAVERTVAWNASASYQEHGISQDKNGNILDLSRTGRLCASIDALSYSYMGNRLLGVTENGDDEEGFIDGNPAGSDYLYDANGNMVTDLNKGIASIQYNHLNLPARVENNKGEYVKYRYDATGTKLSQEVYDASDVLKKNRTTWVNSSMRTIRYALSTTRRAG